MVIGILRLELDLGIALTLKDKRKILNRVKDRVREKFNVSIAEIEGNDLINYACLGAAIVSNEQKFADKVLNKVVDLIDDIRDCVLTDYSTEYLHY